MCAWFTSRQGLPTRYVKLRIAHEPGMPGTFPRHQLQRSLLISNLGMHHSTCITHVPWCMSGSLTRGGRENAPGIPAACATHSISYLARGPWIYLIGFPPLSNYSGRRYDCPFTRLWNDGLPVATGFQGYPWVLLLDNRALWYWNQ